MPTVGHHGRYLRIDATTGTARLVDLDDGTLRRFMGGVGLGAWIVAQTPRRVDPLGPDAAITFALSPLVGSPLTTSAKFAVVAIGPLTGRVCDALSSSHFAIAAKRAGIDALTIVGARGSLQVLTIDGTVNPPAIAWRDAASFAGRTSAEVESALRRELGPDWRVASIGPAGERRIPFATISHDGRHAGRGGLGAVLGSKRIKAVAIRGDGRVPIADPAGTIALARDLSLRSMGPATEKYREAGTVANLLVFNRLGALPTRNFREGSFPEAERLAETDLAPARRVARNSCAACTIGCEHLFANEKGGGGGVRLEYESLFALGPLCGVSDPAVVVEAAARCDAHGLDTISTGGTIAFLMDCASRGWIDAGGPRFGDGPGLLAAIDQLAERRGEVGRLLALGTRRAAAEIGGAAPSIAMHVKGLELPGYDPRSLHAMALGLAVGTRGADHNRSGAYEADFSGGHDRRAGGPDAALAAIATEDKAALMDSLILCKFLRGVFDDFHAEAAAMLAKVAGWDVDSDELRTTARRIVTARKLLNIREGWTPEEDVLPPALLEPGSGLTPERLDALIRAYNLARGWTAEGWVGRELAEALDLAEPAFGFDPDGAVVV